MSTDVHLLVSKARFVKPARRRAGKSPRKSAASSESFAGMRSSAHGAMRFSTFDGSRLRELAEYARGRVGILPGGGVTWENAEEVAAAVGVREVHGTRIVRL